MFCQYILFIIILVEQTNFLTKFYFHKNFFYVTIFCYYRLFFISKFFSSHFFFFLTTLFFIKILFSSQKFCHHKFFPITNVVQHFFILYFITKKISSHKCFIPMFCYHYIFLFYHNCFPCFRQHHMTRMSS